MDHDVRIVPLNESFIEVQCSDSIAYELREVYSFTVPGAHFSPKFKNGVWDGKIRLFNVPKRRIYRGLTNNLVSYLEAAGYTVDYDNPQEEFSVKEANEFIESLGLKNVPRDYQIESFVKAMRYKRLIILSPTGSGKSFTFYLIFRKLIESMSSGMLLVPKVSLVEQMYTDFEEYSEGTDFCVEENVHRLYEGKSKSTDKILTISTWQSIFDLPKDYFKKFEFVMGDEAHLYAAKSLSKVMESMTNTKYRIGTTGTLDGKKVNELVQEGLFGQVERVASTTELMKRKILADLTIKCITLKYSDEACKAARKWNYSQEISFITENERRNRFISNLAMSLDGNTMILFREIAHGQALFDMLDTYPHKKYFVYGKTEVEERESIRKIVDGEKNSIIIASYGVFSTGVNIKNINSIIFARPSKAKIQILQSIGRGLRVSDVKNSVELFDISDDLRYNGKMNYTFNHFSERIRLYIEEEFKFKKYSIDFT